MTFATARQTVREMGFVLTRTPDDEYHINRRGGSEATAYYTTDLEDAVGTARLESQRQAEAPDRA